jgi:hypothetical protein
MNSRRFTARYLPCLRHKGWHASVTAGDSCAAGFHSPMTAVGVLEQFYNSFWSNSRIAEWGSD